MAKAKEKSPAELLREEIERRAAAGKPRKDAPTYTFVDVKVKEAREKAKLKIAWVAEKLGLTPAEVSAAEKGHNVRLRVAMELAGFYGRQVEDLFGVKLKVEEAQPPEPVRRTDDAPPTADLFVDEEGEIHDEVPTGMKL